MTSAPIAGYAKDPSARLDYSIDWSRWLVSGDTISTADWALESGDGALAIATGAYAPSLSGAVATVWLHAGTLGQVYQVRCRVTTTQGRIDDRTMRIGITER